MPNSNLHIQNPKNGTPKEDGSGRGMGAAILGSQGRNDGPAASAKPTISAGAVGKISRNNAAKAAQLKSSNGRKITTLMNHHVMSAN